MAAITLSLVELGVTLPAEPCDRATSARQVAARFVGGGNRPADRQWTVELLRAGALGAVVELCDGVDGLADRLAAMLSVADAAECDRFEIAGDVFSRAMLADAATRVRSLLVAGLLGAAAELCVELVGGFMVNADAAGTERLRQLALRCAPRP